MGYEQDLAAIAATAPVAPTPSVAPVAPVAPAPAPVSPSKGSTVLRRRIVDRAEPSAWAGRLWRDNQEGSALLRKYWYVRPVLESRPGKFSTIRNGGFANVGRMKFHVVGYVGPEIEFWELGFEMRKGRVLLDHTTHRPVMEVLGKASGDLMELRPALRPYALRGLKSHAALYNTQMTTEVFQHLLSDIWVNRGVTLASNEELVARVNAGLIPAPAGDIMSAANMAEGMEVCPELKGKKVIPGQRARPTELNDDTLCHLEPLVIQHNWVNLAAVGRVAYTCDICGYADPNRMYGPAPSVRPCGRCHGSLAPVITARYCCDHLGAAYAVPRIRFNPNDYWE